MKSQELRCTSEASRKQTVAVQRHSLASPFLVFRQFAMGQIGYCPTRWDYYHQCVYVEKWTLFDGLSLKLYCTQIERVLVCCWDGQKQSDREWEYFPTPKREERRRSNGKLDAKLKCSYMKAFLVPCCTWVGDYIPPRVMKSWDDCDFRSRGSCQYPLLRSKVA